MFLGSHLWTLFSGLSSVSYSTIGHIIILLCIGAALAFVMEIFEYLVVHNTSSLTLSVTGIFKEIVQLIFAVEINGDQLSTINTFGLLLCLCGIAGHIWHKSTKNQVSESTSNISSTNASPSTEFKTTEDEIERILHNDKNKRLMENDFLNEQSRKGLLRYESDDEEVEDSVKVDSMDESDQLIFDILKRRDYVSTSK